MYLSILATRTDVNPQAANPLSPTFDPESNERASELLGLEIHTLDPNKYSSVAAVLDPVVPHETNPLSPIPKPAGECRAVALDENIVHKFKLTLYL